MNIFILDSKEYSKKALEIYSKLGKVSENIFEDGKLPPHFNETEVLVIRLNKVTAEMMDAAPNLKVVASPTTGLNHIDLKAAEERGIKVISLRGRREFLDKIYATSENTVALTLALLRRIPTAHQHVLAGGWNRQNFIGSEISGRTVGIIGCGRLGSRVAEIMNFMGAKIVAFDPYQTKESVSNCVSLKRLDDVLAESDILSLHIALTKETEKMAGEPWFAKIKHGSYLINTSRGEVIDEAAFLGALESGRLAGAAIDVMAGEDGSGKHLVGNSLIAYARTHDNLIITPHMSGATRESMALTEELIAEEMVAFFK